MAPPAPAIPFDPLRDPIPAAVRLAVAQGEPVIVALIDASAAGGWGEATRLRLLREWAGGGIPVIAVDLHLDAPHLHRALELGEGEGITDALLYGASLARVLRVPEGEAFRLIQAGTPVVRSEPVLGHRRWGAFLSLLRGEAALSVLCLSADLPGASELLARVDGCVVLGQTDGMDGVSEAEWLADAPRWAQLVEPSASPSDAAVSIPFVTTARAWRYSPPAAGESPGSGRPPSPPPPPRSWDPFSPILPLAELRRVEAKREAPEVTPEPDTGAEWEAIAAPEPSGAEAEEPAAGSADVAWVEVPAVDPAGWEPPVEEATAESEEASGSGLEGADLPSEAAWVAETEVTPEPAVAPEVELTPMPAAALDSAPEPAVAPEVELTPMPAAALEPDPAPEPVTALEAEVPAAPMETAAPELALPRSTVGIGQSASARRRRGKRRRRQGGFPWVVLLILTALGVLGALRLGYLELPAELELPWPLTAPRSQPMQGPGRTISAPSFPRVRADTPGSVGEEAGPLRAAPQAGVAAGTTPDRPPEAPALAWSLGIRAFTSRDAALREARRLEAALPGRTFVVAPIVDAAGSPFHRLLLIGEGPQEAVEEWRELLAPHLPGMIPSDWIVRPVALSFLLGEYPTLEGARARSAELAALGIPGFILVLQGGDSAPVWRVHAGAYPSDAESQGLLLLLQGRGFEAPPLVSLRGRSPDA